MAIVVQSTMLVPQATATSIDVPVQTLSASDQTTPVLATIFRRQRSTGHTTDELTDPPGYRTFREENCDSDLQYSARPAQPASYPITTLKWQPCDSAHPIVFYFKPAQTAAVRVGVWPGAYGQAAVAAMVEPFAAEHPLISATVIELAGSAEVVARLAADPGFVDVANVDARTARTLCDEGLALPIDHDVMLAPGSDGLAGSDFFPGSIQSECFVPQVAYSTVIAYNRATLQSAAPPDKVADFFDIETYPGRRVAPNNPRALLEMGALRKRRSAR